MKRSLVITLGLSVFALLLIGFVVGAIGSEFAGRDPFLEKPQVHLPAGAIFPAEERLDSMEGGNLGLMGLALTNTMLSSFLATIVLLAIFVLGARKKALIPGRFQAFVEIIIESLLNFVEGVAGKDLGRAFFPIIATIFLFVMFNSWMGLLPFYPAIGFHSDSDSSHVTTIHDSSNNTNQSEGGDQEAAGHGSNKIDLFRPAGTDLNMPLALAVVAFLFVEFWGFRILGINYLSKFIRLKGFLRGPAHWFNAAIDAFVGVLEILSELIRVVSFTFRLFGNMLAGEILILISAFLVPFVFSVPFYGLELLVGLIQGMIFAGLTLTFASVAVVRHEEH